MRGRLLPALRVGVGALILAAVVWAFASNWAEVSADLARLGWPGVALALVLAVACPVLALMGWRVLMADLGSPLPVAPASGIFFVGQLGKYLPGSVWTVLAQAEMGARLHIPRRRSAVVGLVSIGLSVLSGLVVGLASVPLLLRGGSGSTLLWALLALPVLGLACWPRLLNAAVDRGLRLLKREPLEHDLSGRAIATTMAWFMGSWLTVGLSAYVLSVAVGGQAGGSLPVAAISGYALAGTLGMLAVIAPAGIGVREAVLVLLLRPHLGGSGALAVVLVSRFCVTVGDVLVAVVGWAYARRHHLLSAHPGHDQPVSDEPVHDQPVNDEPVSDEPHA